MLVNNVWRVWFALILTMGLMTSTNPAHALGTPQFVSIDPPQTSPQIIGVCIYVTVKVDWDNDFRDMRVRFGHEGWQHSSETQFSRIFCTKDYDPGVYKLRVEVAGKDDNNWDHPKVTEVDYELKNLQDFYPPNTVAIFGSKGTFNAKVGSDLYRIQDGVIVDWKDVRWLVPNRETAEALCIFWDTKGNLWDLSDSDILSISRGPDIPDITKEPEEFWTFRNKYFPYCGYVPSQPTLPVEFVATESPQQTTSDQQTQQQTPPEQTTESGWWCKNIGWGCNNDVGASEAPYTTLPKRGPVDDHASNFLQCAEYASEKRPDSLCWLGTPADGGMWVASLSEFEKTTLGITIDNRPDVGDIVEFVNCPKGYPSNHVAWVSSVSYSDMKFGIYDANRKYDGIKREDDYKYNVNKCMSFISQPTNKYTSESSYCYVYQPVNKPNENKNIWDKITSWWNSWK